MGNCDFWSVENWFVLVQSFGIIAGLSFSGLTTWRNSRILRVQTLINITEQHRSIWLQVNESRDLVRILQEDIDLSVNPVKPQEMVFVNLMLLHLSSVFVAMEKGVIDKPAGLDMDIVEFFSLPIPLAVWKETQKYRDPLVFDYVDRLIP